MILRAKLLLFIIRFVNAFSQEIQDYEIATEKRANERPWFMEELSSQFVRQAVAYRSPNVPVYEASTIANSIIQGALSPPQVTVLFSAVSNAFIEGGTDLPPQQVLGLVQMASRVYGEIKTSAGFENYLKYVSANARLFNVGALLPFSSKGFTLESVLQSQLSRLQMTAQGQEAIRLAHNLMTEVESDAGLLPIGGQVGRPGEMPRPGVNRIPPYEGSNPNYEAPRPMMPPPPPAPSRPPMHSSPKHGQQPQSARPLYGPNYGGSGRRVYSAYRPAPPGYAPQRPQSPYNQRPGQYPGYYRGIQDIESDSIHDMEAEGSHEAEAEGSHEAEDEGSHETEADNPHAKEAEGSLE